MKIAIYTLGCKVNQYETQAMEAELSGRGHTLVPFEGHADAYIINTCTVTAVSDKKSRQIIRRARKENPDAVIGVCGCYAQTNPEAVRALEVDLISGTAGRMAFLDDLEELLEDRRAARMAAVRCPRAHGCVWAVWSPAPLRKNSAAGPLSCPICVPISTCPCRAAATVCSGG